MTPRSLVVTVLALVALAPPARADGQGPAPAAVSGTPGGRWMGVIIGGFWTEDDTALKEQTFTIRLILREAIVPTFVNRRTVHQLILLNADDVSFSEAFFSEEKLGGGTRCSGRGETNGTATPAVGSRHVKMANIDITSYLGYDVPAGREMYLLAPIPPIGATFDVTCRDRYNTNVYQQGYTSSAQIVGRYPNGPASGPLADAEVRYLTDGRMEGHYETHDFGIVHSAVAWSLCREGVNCPPPRPLPERAPRSTRTTCGPPTAERALLDTANEQQRAIVAELARLHRQYESLADQSRQWQDDFDQATRDCGLWIVGKFLASLLLTGPSAPKIDGRVLPVAPGRPAPDALPALEPGKEFVNFLNFVEKVAAGDGSWVLPNSEFNGWASVEDAWDAFQGAYGALGPSSPASLKQGLQQCGAPTIDGVLDGAYEYLRLLEEIKPLADRMNRLLNDARSKDNEIFNKWAALCRACLRYEACREGGDPASCGCNGLPE